MDIQEEEIKIMENKILDKFKEIESMIIKGDYLHRCPIYEKDCSQCEFWKRFDWLVNFIKENQEVSKK